MSTETKKPSYWGVHNCGKVLYRGTHTECWLWLVNTYVNDTLASLVERDIKIARTN